MLASCSLAKNKWWKTTIGFRSNSNCCLYKWIWKKNSQWVIESE